MSKSSQEEAYSRQWYEDNKEVLSAARKEKYQTDSAYRKRAVARARQYRADRRKGHRVGRVIHREFKGRIIPVYTTGQVADVLGRSRQMICGWEERGLLPFTVFPDKHRLYTAKQVQLIKRLHIALGQPDLQKSQLTKVLKYVHTHWED